MENSNKYYKATEGAIELIQNGEKDVEKAWKCSCKKVDVDSEKSCPKNTFLYLVEIAVRLGCLNIEVKISKNVFKTELYVDIALIFLKLCKDITKSIDLWKKVIDYLKSYGEDVTENRSNHQGRMDVVMAFWDKLFKDIYYLNNNSNCI